MQSIVCPLSQLRKCDKYTEALVAIFSPKSAQPTNWWCPEGILWSLYRITSTSAVIKILFHFILFGFAS